MRNDTLYILRAWIGKATAYFAPIVAGLLCLPQAGWAQTNLLRYTFDEASSGTTTALDSSGSTPKANGTFSGTGTRTTTTPGGYPAAAFDAGSGGYIDAGDVDKLDTLQKMSITAWIRLYGAPTVGQAILGKQPSDNSSGFVLQFANNSAGASLAANKFGIKWRVGGIVTGNVNDLNADNAWIFVAVTYDGSASSGNVKFYNGNATTTVTLFSTKNNNAGTPIANSTPFQVCAGGSGAATPSVMVDDVRVYNDVLSQTDLEAVRLANVPPTTALWWDRNGATAGAGGSAPNGVWSGSGVLTANNNWSSASSGNLGTQQWTDGNSANFAAGTDGTGSYTITVSNTPTASAINIEEGTVLFNRSAITLIGGGAVDVASGAGATFDSTTLAGTVGLTKTSGGTLTLAQANTYSGNTTISGGTLALSGSGSINSSSIIQVGGGATFDVSGVSGYALASGQTLKGVGNVNGAVTVASGATLAPGGSIGTLAFNNDLTLNSGGTTSAEVDRNGGTPLSDRAQGIGTLTEGGTLQVVNNGAALQINDSFTLLSATTYSGEFASVSPANPNSDAELAWDTPALKSSGVLRVHHVPYATNQLMFRGKGMGGKVKFADLFPGTDPLDGDTVVLASFTAGSQGASITTNATYLFYTPANDNSDSFNYTVTDGRGGARMATITVSVTSSVGSVTITNAGGGSMTLSFYGIPGYQYVVQRSCGNLSSWVDLVTNTAAGNGLVQFTDAPGGGCAPAFYRMRSE